MSFYLKTGRVSWAFLLYSFCVYMHLYLAYLLENFEVYILEIQLHLFSVHASLPMPPSQTQWIWKKYSIFTILDSIYKLPMYIFTYESKYVSKKNHLIQSTTGRTIKWIGRNNSASTTLSAYYYVRVQDQTKTHFQYGIQCQQGNKIVQNENLLSIMLLNYFPQITWHVAAGKICHS